jgi:hypothetical protein
MVKNKKRIFITVLGVLTLLGNYPLAVFAQSSSSSTNYKIDEAYFGTGGEVDSSSTNYRAQQGSGALGVGSTSSTNYDANAGALSPAEPFLELSVMSASVNFGTFSDSAYSYGAAQAGACNCSFYVRTYNSGNYSVVSVSQPPTSENGDALDAMTVLGVPSNVSSVEEFGINLVDNATPNIGANPSNQPDNTFADGQAAPGYDTPDQFKYVAGGTIARSQATAGNPAIGLTNYTISYVAKPAINTPAGQYTMNQVLVAIATF